MSAIARMVDLCTMARPYLSEGSQLYASGSLVVAINRDAPLADRLTDIQSAEGFLKALASGLAAQQKKPKTP